MRCLRWGVLTGSRIPSIHRYAKPRRGSGWAFFSRIIDPVVASRPAAIALGAADWQLIGPLAGITPKYRHVIAMDFVPLCSHWIHEYGIERDWY